MNEFAYFPFTSVVFIKRGPQLEGDKSLASQLRIMNFSDGSPYETLHAYISNAVAPYFKSYIKETGKAERLVRLHFKDPQKFLLEERSLKIPKNVWENGKTLQKSLIRQNTIIICVCGVVDAHYTLYSHMPFINN